MIALVMQDANQDFKNKHGRGPAAPMLRRICNALLEFVSALDEGNMDKCKLPRATAAMKDSKGDTPFQSPIDGSKTSLAYSELITRLHVTFMSMAAQNPCRYEIPLSGARQAVL